MIPTRSMRRLCALLLAGSIGIGPSWAGPVQLEGVTMTERLHLAGNSLMLNGVGVRAVAWLKGYVAGLYLTRKSTSAAEVIAAPGPKRLQLRMLQNVAAQEFVKAFDRGVKRHSSDAEIAALAQRMQGFEQIMHAAGAVKKGDVIDLDYVPASGTTMTINGRLLGAAIAGADFYAALMKVFVGEKVSDPELRAGLLGGTAN